jgi:hypothetical protein
MNDDGPIRVLVGHYENGSDTDLVIPAEVLRAADAEIATERERRRREAAEARATAEAAAAAARKSWFGRLRAIFRGSR